MKNCLSSEDFFAVVIGEMIAGASRFAPVGWKPLGWWAAIMAVFALPLVAAHLVAWRRAVVRRVRESRVD